MATTKTIYTTAPSDYDYGWTSEIEAIAGVAVSNGKIWRRVEIIATHADGQCMRYGSGLHGAVDCREFAKMIDLGLVVYGEAARQCLAVGASR